MSLAHARIAFAIAAALIFVTAVARAQDDAAPIPDSSYGDNADSYQSSNDLPTPPADDLSNSNSVTIPIPGGGEITVDGPDGPNEPALPTSPGSEWGVQELTPNSHDVGPIGP